MKKLIKKIIRYISTKLAKRQLKQFGKELNVNFPCKFTKNTVVGNNCNFNGIHISGMGNLTIGNNFHSGKECMIMTSFHNYDSGETIPYDNTYISKDVKIGDNVWLGHRVIILAGVTIEEGAIIQAGSVIVGNIPYCAIAGGHPAKVFKYRNTEHYENLKKEQKYF